VSSFQPRLESLEDRVQLGDTIFGLWTMGRSGLSFFPADGLPAPEPGTYYEPPPDGFHVNRRVVDP
jgi:hypothetical protein